MIARRALLNLEIIGQTAENIDLFFLCLFLLVTVAEVFITFSHLERVRRAPAQWIPVRGFNFGPLRGGTTSRARKIVWILTTMLACLRGR